MLFRRNNNQRKLVNESKTATRIRRRSAEVAVDPRTPQVTSASSIDLDWLILSRDYLNLMNISSLAYKAFNVLGCVVEDIHVESSDGKAKDNNPNELTRASNVAFNSMPYSSASPLVPSAEVSKQLLSKSCPDPRDCEQSSIMDADLFQQVDECVSLRNIFSSHWSLDAVNQALEVCLPECNVLFINFLDRRKLIVVFSL